MDMADPTVADHPAPLSAVPATTAAEPVRNWRLLAPSTGNGGSLHDGVRTRVVLPEQAVGYNFWSDSFGPSSVARVQSRLPYSTTGSKPR